MLIDFKSGKKEFSDADGLFRMAHMACAILAAITQDCVEATYTWQPMIHPIHYQKGTGSLRLFDADAFKAGISPAQFSALSHAFSSAGMAHDHSSHPSLYQRSTNIHFRDSSAATGIIPRLDFCDRAELHALTAWLFINQRMISENVRRILYDNRGPQPAFDDMPRGQKARIAIRNLATRLATRALAKTL